MIHTPAVRAFLSVSHTEANIDQPADTRSFVHFRFNSSRRDAGRGAAAVWRRRAHSAKSQPDVPEPGRQVGGAPPPLPPHHDGSGSSSNLLGITFNSHAFAGVAG